MSTHSAAPCDSDQRQKETDGGIHLLDIAIVVAESKWLLILGPLLVGMLTLAATFLYTPRFTAKTVLLAPQQQGAGAAMLQSLGGLAGLAGATVGIKSPADQFVALMQSNRISDRIIFKFRLREGYVTDTLQGARDELATNVRASVGKKDGLLIIEVDDPSPQRAADMANEYVEQLRLLSGELALTEAQQRRAFFEKQMQATQGRLAHAQRTLQASGINQGAIRAEPKAAAEAYAAIKAQVTAAEIRLQGMRATLTEEAPEFRQMLRHVQALRGELQRTEAVDSEAASGEYINKYREFKYQEALFEQFTRQYELARLDESRDGSSIQVVDIATPPERKSRPRRGAITVFSVVGSGLVLLMFVFVRRAFQDAAAESANAKKLNRLRTAICIKR